MGYESGKNRTEVIGSNRILEADVINLFGGCNRNYIWCENNFEGSRNSCSILCAAWVTSAWFWSVSPQITMDTCSTAGDISGTYKALESARFSFLFIFSPIWLCKAWWCKGFARADRIDAPFCSATICEELLISETFAVELILPARNIYREEIDTPGGELISSGYHTQNR